MLIQLRPQRTFFTQHVLHLTIPSLVIGPKLNNLISYLQEKNKINFYFQSKETDNSYHVVKPLSKKRGGLMSC